MPRDTHLEVENLVELYFNHPEEVYLPNSIRFSTGRKICETKFREKLDQIDNHFIIPINVHFGTFYKELTESFIEYFLNNLSFLSISGYSCLSEDFIEKYFYKLSLLNILNSQKLSGKFLLRHKKKFTYQCWVNIRWNHKIDLSEQELTELEDYIPIDIFEDLLIKARGKKWAVGMLPVA